MNVSNPSSMDAAQVATREAIVCKSSCVKNSLRAFASYWLLTVWSTMGGYTDVSSGRTRGGTFYGKARMFVRFYDEVLEEVAEALEMIEPEEVLEMIEPEEVAEVLEMIEPVVAAMLEIKQEVLELLEIKPAVAASLEIKQEVLEMIEPVVAAILEIKQEVLELLEIKPQVTIESVDSNEIDTADSKPVLSVSELEVVDMDFTYV